MKKRLHILLTASLFILLSTVPAWAQLINKNGTPQAPNYDFEVWDGTEPWGWNGCADAFVGPAATSKDLKTSVVQSTDVRPGSKGKTSAFIRATENSSFTYFQKSWGIFGTAKTTNPFPVGTLTTGRIFLWGIDKHIQDGKTGVWSQINEGAHCWSFNGKPDSLVVWVKSANGNARMSVLLHANMHVHEHYPDAPKKGDMNDYEYVGSGSTPPMNGLANGDILGSINHLIPNNGGQWQRIALPISCTGTPSYALITFYVNEGGLRKSSLDDGLFVDDMLFIYKPTLKIGSSLVTKVGLRNGSHTAHTVPFELKGTMSPFNNLPNNEVIAYLSDKNGDFATQIEVGRFTTDESGNLTISIPGDIPSSKNYKLKLVSTNYPLLSNVVTLDIFHLYNLSISINKPWAGKVNSVDTLVREYTPWLAQILGTYTGNHFSYWTANGDSVSSLTNYPITLDRNYAIEAIFDTNYYRLQIHQTLGGTADFAENNQANCTVIHNGEATLRATPNFGYHFSRWISNDGEISTESPHKFNVVKNLDISPVFDTNEYQLSFTAIPAKCGQTTGSGTYKHGYAATTLATAQAHCTFLYWKKAGKDDIYSYEPELSIDPITEAISLEAYFKEDLYSVSVGQDLEGAGNVTGDSTYSAFLVTEKAQVEAFPAYGFHFTHWTYAIDGVSQEGELNKNPHVILEKDHVVHNYDFTAHFDTNRYLVSITESTHGMVKGDGSYVHGSEVSLLARPQEGYHFVQWENLFGQVLSTDTILVFSSISQDTNIKALFAVNSYAVNLRVEGSAFGQILEPSDGNYDHFTLLNLQAETFAGSEFRSWIVNGDTLSLHAQCELLIDGPKEIVAIFSPLRKQLTLNMSPNNYGSVLGDGLYEHAEPALAQANPFYGYHFIAWQDAQGVSYSQNPLQISALTQDSVFTALFGINKYQICLEKNIEGGEIRIEGHSNLCDHFPYQTEIDFYATPSPIHHFLGWKNAQGETLATETHLRLFLTQDSLVTAFFELNKYTVSASIYPEKAGNVKGVGNYDHGSHVHLEAQALFGYTFEGWYQGDVLKSTDSSLEIDSLFEATYLTARFSVQEFNLSLLAKPENAGTLEGSGKVKYKYNTRVEAKPKTSYDFVGWYTPEGQMVSTKAVYYPVILSHDTLVAHFKPASLQVAWQILPHAKAGTIENIPHQYIYAQEYSVTAQGAYGYQFSHWINPLEPETSLGTEKEFRFSPTQNLTLAAVFDPISFDLNALCLPQEAGQILGSGSFSYGSLQTLSAQAKAHYDFVAWVNAEGDTLSKEPEFQIRIEESKTITACFKAQTARLSTHCQPEKSGEIQIQGETRYFQTIVLEAQANPGYHFIQWNDGNKEASRSVYLDQDKDLTAHFETSSYLVSLDVEPLGAGTANGQGEYLYQEKASLSAQANNGFTFYAYLDSKGEVLSFDPNYKVSVKESLSLTASFVANPYQIRVISSQEEVGKVRGNGIYSYGTKAEISSWATAPGYIFSHWSTSASSQDTLSKQAVLDFTVTKDQTFYAHFTKLSYQIQISIEPEAGGEVSGNGKTFYGSEMRLHAMSREGYRFVGFTEFNQLITPSNDYVFSVSGDRNITAVFEPIRVKIEAQNIPKGVMVLGTGTYNYGSLVSIEALLPPRLEFVAWVNTQGDTVGKTNPHALTLKQDEILSLVYQDRFLNLDLSVSPAKEAGVVEGQGSYLYGESAVLRAISNTGYEFVGWQENGKFISYRDTCYYKILEHAQVVGVFKKKEATVLAVSNLSLGGNTSGSGSYILGSTAQLEAKSYVGFHFVSWSEDGAIISTNPLLSLLVDKAHTLVANFKMDQYNITTQSRPTLGATIIGEGFYGPTDSIKLIANVSQGYRFLAWEYEGEIISTENPCTLTATKNMQITAVTEKLQLTVSAEAYPKVSGKIEGTGEYDNGAQVTLTATAQGGFYFDQWVDEQQRTVSMDPSFSFTAKTDVYYTALFAQKNVNDQDERITMYPMPFHDKLHIAGNNLDKLYIFNQMGALVAEYPINSASLSILYTSSMPSGIYTYQIIRNSGKIAKGKIIKY